MNSRERLQSALFHQEPDRIPCDLGTTTVTGIHVDAYRRLRTYLGLREVDIEIFQLSQQIAVVDQDVRQILGVDVEPILPGIAAGGEVEILEAPEYTAYYDEWGIGQKMPKDSPLYYSMHDHPLADVRDISELRDYPFPDPTDPLRFSGYSERAEEIIQAGKGVIVNNISGGTMETASWMRGLENYFADLALNEKLAMYLLDKVLEIKLAYWEIALDKLGDKVDVVIESDDLGAQEKTLISPSMYRRLIKPRHKKLFDFIHSRSNAKIFFHSCGAIRPLIPDLIEIGVDILNPVQVTSAGMETEKLKHDFGRDLVFWGGAVDTQGILGTATPAQVKDEVRRRIDDLAPGGGFIFAAVHNIQANVPPENIMAMWEILHEFGY